MPPAMPKAGDSTSNRLSSTGVSTLLLSTGAQLRVERKAEDVLDGIDECVHRGEPYPVPGHQLVIFTEHIVGVKWGYGE